MTIEFQLQGIKDSSEIRRQVEADLDHLGQLIPVACASVAFQCQREVTPPFQAVAVLAVTGTSIAAAARDYAWPVAWRKVVTRLHQQLEGRQDRRTGSETRKRCVNKPACRRAGVNRKQI
jgi:hypothetical protein